MLGLFGEAGLDQAGLGYEQGAGAGQCAELIEKLAALVPPRRLNLVRYHGVLAPNAADRARIVPGPHERTEEREADGVTVWPGLTCSGECSGWTLPNVPPVGGA